MLIKSNLFLCQQSLKVYYCIFSSSVFCFHIAEAYLDVTFCKNAIFDDILITLAICSEK